MMKTATVRLVGAMVAVAIAAIACREPTGDPKTPPNSPLPSIDNKDEPWLEFAFTGPRVVNHNLKARLDYTMAGQPK